MFSFQRYRFHFGALTKKENIIFFVDRTRFLSISICSAVTSMNDHQARIESKTTGQLAQ